MKGGDEVQASLGGNPKCLVPGLIEILAKLHQVRTEGGDRRVLVWRIPVGHVDRCRYAGARGRKGNRLSMVAARRGNDARYFGLRLGKPIQIYDPAAHFE